MNEPNAHDLKTNKAIVRSVIEDGWNAGTVTRIEGHLAEELALHIRGHSRKTNAKELRQIIARWHEAFQDMHFDVHAVIAEGDLVAVRLTLKGKHVGEWKGTAPTGRNIAVTHMWFFRLLEGRIVEVWEELDALGMLQQIGAIET